LFRSETNDLEYIIPTTWFSKIMLEMQDALGIVEIEATGSNYQYCQQCASKEF
jgi:hypothetical protein